LNKLFICAETGAETPPTLKAFEEEIQRYKALEKAAKALPVTRNVGWTRIDAKPLKKALEVLVSKWSYLYIKYLQVRCLVGCRQGSHKTVLVSCANCQHTNNGSGRRRPAQIVQWLHDFSGALVVVFDQCGVSLSTMA
jgi:hypothetical protein